MLGEGIWAFSAWRSERLIFYRHRKQSLTYNVNRAHVVTLGKYKNNPDLRIDYEMTREIRHVYQIPVSIFGNNVLGMPLWKNGGRKCKWHGTNWNRIEIIVKKEPLNYLWVTILLLFVSNWTLSALLCLIIFLTPLFLYFQLVPAFNYFCMLRKLLTLFYS